MNDKIKEIIDKKFYSILSEFCGPLWPFGKWTTAFSKNGRRKLLSNWKSYLKLHGMKVVTEKRRHSRSSKIYLNDPATDFLKRNDLFYIEIPCDLALKIIVLGSLP